MDKPPQLCSTVSDDHILKIIESYLDLAKIIPTRDAIIREVMTSTNGTANPTRVAELWEALRPWIKLGSRAANSADRYQALCRRTVNKLEPPQDLVMPTLGLAGEAGEVVSELEGDGGSLSVLVGRVCERIKKHVFHHKDLDRDALKKELGDVQWYLAVLADAARLTLSEVMQANVDKLAARYPLGFPGTHRGNLFASDQTTNVVPNEVNPHEPDKHAPSPSQVEEAHDIGKP